MRTVADVLAGGCPVCGDELDPETAVVVVGKFLSTDPLHDDEAKWSENYVSFICPDDASELQPPEPEPGGSFSTIG